MLLKYAIVHSTALVASYHPPKQYLGMLLELAGERTIPNRQLGYDYFILKTKSLTVWVLAVPCHAASVPGIAQAYLFHCYRCVLSPGTKIEKTIPWLVLTIQIK